MRGLLVAAAVGAMLACGAASSFARETAASTLQISVKVVHSCIVETDTARRGAPVTVDCGKQAGAAAQIVLNAPAGSRHPNWAGRDAAPSPSAVERSRDKTASGNSQSPSRGRTTDLISVDDGADTVRLTIDF